MKNRKSETLFQRAKKVIPGGVNSPVRAYNSVGMDPPFIRRSSGARLWDADGNHYIDYVGSWGPMILGHTNPVVIKALRSALRNGTSFGAPTELEVNMAELITKLMPSIELVRMVNSGTEATMSAIRLARSYTGRDKILKFEGCYHGHGDSFLIKAGSGAATFGIPDSPGVPKALAAETLNARYNDIGSVQKLVDQFPSQIAAIIVEPVVGNMGCVPPKPGFLEALRQLCVDKKIVFIMDEVMTGFRLAIGGAQQLYNIRPDLTTLGKIIGGGLPVGAYGGKKEIMELVSPSGPTYQAGTLSGNPLAMSAGFAMLSQLSRNKSIFKKLELRSRQLEDGIRENLKAIGVPLTYNRVGSMFTLFFTTSAVTDYDTAKQSDTVMFAEYFRNMIKQGIYLPPSQFEAAFLSLAHTDSDIERTISANRKSLERVFSSSSK